ncbi:MAG: FeoB small GTPase domain-containing protein, partial [Acidobacteriota bacterium]
MLVDRAVPAIAIIGNPNTGKTTLFNALTGLAHKVGNYPGVTVERRAGVLKLTSGRVEVIDLPGTYSLAARSLDEAIAVDTLLGRQSQERSLDAVIAVIDAANLDRNLYLLSQLMDFSVPVVVALNMMDAAQRRGIQIDVQRLSQRLGVPVVPMRADRGEGVDQLRDAIARTLNQGRADAPARALPLPEGLNGPIEKLLAQFGDCITPPLQRPELLRALVDTGGAVEQRLDSQLGTPFGDALRVARSE